LGKNEVMLAEAKQRFGNNLLDAHVFRGELTLKVERDAILSVCHELRDNPLFGFEQLIDLCGVDYLEYGTVSPRPGPDSDPDSGDDSPRFAVVYHLLSIANNQRLRVRAFLDEEQPMIDSVVPIWRVADWFEREAFDLFGIIFEGHSDLRRILTDYGFIGHPFRKDFPLTGRVEMRYDPDKGRVVYQPVTIEARTLVPKVIREEDFGDRNS
jgi:NADH-quinone oxidoreductase subunit C